MTAEDLRQEDEGKYWPQVMAIIIISLGTLTSGMHFTWSSPFSLQLVQDKVNYDITEDDVSLLMLFQSVGMIIMSLIFFRLSELLGRKNSILFLALPQTLTWIITIFAKSKWEFYLSRLISGAGDSIVFGSIPPYVGEITTPVVRDTCGNLPTFAIYGGQFFITVIGSYCDVKTTAYICLALPILLVLFTSFLPESPYQLIKEGKMKQAKESIKWFRRKKDVEKEFQQMKADVERQISERGSWLDLIKIPSNRKALRAGVFLRISQQLSGISAFQTFTQMIFLKAGGNLSPQSSSMIFTFLIWTANLICSIVVAKFGRKSSYFYSLLTSGFILMLMAVYFLLEQFNVTNLEKFNWFPLAGMIVYVFTYSSGLSVVPTLMLGELFSASIKAKGLGVLIVVFGVGILLGTNLFHLLTNNIGLFAPFLLYSVCCFVSSFLTMKWVPETKGKTLEEIQQSLKHTNK